MKYSTFRKILLSLFAIIETTERGKRWKKVEAGRQVKWV